MSEKKAIHPAVAAYSARAAAGAKKAKEARRASEPRMPDLSAAHAQYDPQKDGPLTLGKIRESQDNQGAVIRKSDEPARLSKETIAGLQLLHQQVDKDRVMTQEAAAPKEPEKTPQQEDTSEQKPTKEADGKGKNYEIDEGLDAMTDLEIEMLLRRTQQDVINNEEQRKRIEKDLKPMDLADGLMTGEFTQHVPIKPGVLEVTFRSLTPLEHEELRRMVLVMQLADERLAGLTAQRLALMQTVASIKALSGKELPQHIKKDEKGAQTFLEDVFMSKYNLYRSWPSQLLDSLGANAYWFEQRVRKLFTMEALKN